MEKTSLQLIALLLGLSTIGFAAAFFFQLSDGSLELFVRRNQGILTSIGTLLFLALVAFFTTVFANRAADRREEFSQKMQALIKVSEFRQKWIDRMREDLSRISELVFSMNNNDDLYELYGIVSRVLLSLNLSEEASEKLHETLIKILECLRNDEPTSSLVAELQAVSNVMLRKEWSRLKNNLKEAQTIGEILK